MDQAKDADKQIFESLDQGASQHDNTFSQRALHEGIQNLQKEQLAWLKSKRKHRKKFDNKIFKLLCAQVIFLCVLVVFQGFGWGGFELDNVVFGFFINGSLVYTYALIRYIASDLFNGNSSLLNPEKVGANRQEPSL